MFTIVTSSTTMSWARPTVPRISHRRSGGALARSAGRPGTRPVGLMLALVLLIALTYLEVPSPLRRPQTVAFGHTCDAVGRTGRRRRAQEVTSAWSAGMPPGTEVPRWE